MILIRIDRVKGDVAIPGYVDWFVAESFDFSVGSRVSVKESSQDLEREESDSQELSITKTTDCATVYLMHMAMKGRSQSGTQVTTVDIHVIEPKHLAADDANTKPVKAFLKIRIENAIVQTWSISGSDSRPSETISIWFNRAAMKYASSSDGKTFQVHGPLGWDQFKNQDWKPDSLMRE